MECKENDYRKICFYCASVYEEKDKDKERMTDGVFDMVTMVEQI